MAVITTAEYKTFWGLSGSTYDTQLGILIPALQAQAERWCGTYFEETQVTLTFNGNGSNRLQTPSPLGVITSVILTDEDGNNLYTYDAADYAGEASTGLLTLVDSTYGRYVDTSYSLGEPGWQHSNGWPVGINNIKVLAKWGYATVPTDLKLAMYLATNKWFQFVQAGSIPNGQFASESLGAYSYSLNTSATQPGQAGSYTTSIISEHFAPWKVRYVI